MKCVKAYMTNNGALFETKELACKYRTMRNLMCLAPTALGTKESEIYARHIMKNSREILSILIKADITYVREVLPKIEQEIKKESKKLEKDKIK